MTQHRISFNINGSACPDYQRLLNFMRIYRPTTALVMDNYDLAVAIHTITDGQTKVCHRAYNAAEGNEWRVYANDIAGYVDSLTNWGHPEIYRYGPNESAITTDTLPAMLNWCIAVVKEFDRRGYKIVMPGGLAIGGVTQEQVESGLFDNFLIFMQGKSIGVHEYTGIELSFGVGQWSQPGRLPPDHTYVTPLDFFLDTEIHASRYWPKSEHLPVARTADGSLPGYWHIRRSDWLTIRARELGLPDPLFWVTEMGWDSMPDIGQVYAPLTDKWGRAGYDNLRGLNSLEGVWAAYWPTWTRDEAAFYQLQWLDSIYPANYIGCNLFMWTSDHWRREGFDMSGNIQLLDLLLQNATTPEPEPEPEPPPTDKPQSTMWLTDIALFILFIIDVLGTIWVLTHQTKAQLGGVTMETLQIMPVDEAGKVLLAAIMAILAGGLSSPVTTPIVNVVKLILRRIGKEKAIGGNIIAAIVAAIVTVIIWVSRWAGVELEVNNLLDLLTTVIPPVLTFVGLVAGQKKLFSWSVEKELPVYGYQRSK